ncbi:MAG: hypothetical protein SOZ04_05400 [Bacilli bacterium]|nr:hypothetical protein [Bacilli bacterium]
MQNEETKTMKQFLITLIIVIIGVVGIYLLTKYVVKKDNATNNSSNTEEKNYIDPNTAIVGTMLNKSSDAYYVIIYDKTKDNATTYYSLVSTYKAKDKALKVYTVDLSNSLNKKYIATDNKTNPKATNLEDLKFGEVTLLKVKNNKITEAYETTDAIKKALDVK